MPIKNDPAHKFVDDSIDAYSSKAAKIYRKAAIDTEIAFQHFLDAHREELEAKQAQLQSGEITREEYQGWCRSVMFGSDWNELLMKICDIQLKANQKAIGGLNDAIIPVFIENYNYGTYQIESAR